MRNWMPLFSYSFPVMMIGSIVVGLASIVLENSKMLEISDYGIFGWIQARVFWNVLYMGIVPGILGHTSVNFVVKHLAPVIVSVALLLEPFVGSFLSWALGYSSIPHLFTWIGAVLNISATAFVSYSAEKRHLYHNNIPTPSPSPSTSSITESPLPSSSSTETSSELIG